ncbi:MAG TPA: insulinase family protein, partial [Gammaproteobacteria bacterium]|nr:insulinase family protein [Gammaproteobacteria bacterium]
MKRPITALLAASLLATAHGAEDEFDIPFDEFVLENGLRVIVHEDRKAPIVSTTLWYHVGSKNENPGKTGFAHLFEHLMFNGSENHDEEYFT